MAAEILLVIPPIYDFAAYDFWMKPYGMLSAAGFVQRRAELRLFDYLDRLHPFVSGRKECEPDKWGRGRFHYETIPNPPELEDIPRFYRRFGLPRRLFREFLAGSPPADFVFIQTMMTYWYPGVAEVIEDVRRSWPASKIVLGGNYVTLCAEHAQTLGADLIIRGRELEPLRQFIGLEPDHSQLPPWRLYPKLKTGVLKVSDGCPFRCTYCSVPKVYGGFAARDMEHALAELQLLASIGARDVAFYDDALLFEAEHLIMPFLDQVIERGLNVNFHTPNALNARFITAELAELMVAAGFKTFYLGFESASEKWQKQTGSKVFSQELVSAVENLKAAGADPADITAYQMLGHPRIDIQKLEESMHFVASLGIRGMLADFSPVPGTPDGDYCSKWVDMAEPLFHNKTAFPVILLGFDETNRLKDLQRKLNRGIR
jgi:radical SAM superfamily enzyme YgiQ (UPF0313 family)